MRIFVLCPALAASLELTHGLCHCSWPRERIYTGAPHEFGYHQMFEELFEAHEEKLPPRAMDAFTRSERPSVPRTKLKMNTQYEAFNPHLRHMAVSYKCAPSAPDVPKQHYTLWCPNCCTGT